MVAGATDGAGAAAGATDGAGAAPFLALLRAAAGAGTADCLPRLVGADPRDWLCLLLRLPDPVNASPPCPFALLSELNTSLLSLLLLLGLLSLLSMLLSLLSSELLALESFRTRAMDGRLLETLWASNEKRKGAIGLGVVGSTSRGCGAAAGLNRAGSCLEM